jgi:hypothetical protein
MKQGKRSTGHFNIRCVKDTQPVLIWADAVCIDQGTVSEVNHQLRLMAKIYFMCKEVLIWFGEHEDLNYRIPRELEHIPAYFQGDEADFSLIGQFSAELRYRRDAPLAIDYFYHCACMLS